MKDENGIDLRDDNNSRWWIDDLLKQNFDFVKEKVSNVVSHKRSDFFVIIDGPVGSGKSTQSFQCAKYFDPTFDLSRVIFSVDDFLKTLIDAKPGQSIVFDEAIIVNSRSALTEFNKKIIIAMTQIRSKGLYIFFNIPSVFDLDKNLVLNRCHLLIHCFQDGFGERGKYIVFDNEKMKVLYLKGKRTYSYGYPKANFVARFKEYFPLDREEYEAKKQREIAKQAIPEKGHKWVRQRNRFIKYLFDNVFIGKKVEEKFKLLSDIGKDVGDEEIKALVYRVE